MTTKSAILPRLLPGLSTLPPTATSAGYTMPHERFFIYGIGFSALVHAAVLFGFPARTPITPPAPPPPLVVARLWDNPLPLEELPPPPPVTVETKSNAKGEEGERAEDSASRASIPDRIFDADHGAITMTGPLDPGLAADPNRIRWDVPMTSGAPLNRNGIPLINEKDLDDKPVATGRAAPRYPTEAKRLGLSGTVLLRFIVDHRGNVSEVEVIKAEHEEFVRAASEAVMRWKFTPGRKNGRAVNTRMEMPMVFSLANAT